MRDNQYTTEGRIRFSEVDHTRRITLPGIRELFSGLQHISVGRSRTGNRALQRAEKSLDPVVVAGSRRTVSGDRREDTDQYLGDRFQGIVRGA